MAVDLTVSRARDVAGVRRRVIGAYTGPAVYVAGGDPLTATDVGLGTIEFLDFENGWDLTNPYVPFYDYANAKVVWVDHGTGNEVVGGTDMSDVTVRFEAVGY